jgi:uracil phosphoribosyltransferase
MQQTPYPSVTVVDHPLVQHKLTILRDVTTGSKQFRELVKELAMLEAYEATRGFQLGETKVLTPIAETVSFELIGKKVAVIPILRAGLGMVDGILELIPAARVGHIGLYRDPETLKPVEYYCKLPEDIAERDVLIVDPMLATGGSASAAIEFLRDRGARQIRLLVIIAAPEGIAEVVNSCGDDVHIYTCSIDDHLNDHGYIVPGLGDAGDRLFGTK